MWDTPDPPRGGNFHHVGFPNLALRRVRHIDLSKCTGITIFCSGARIYGIHAHSALGTSAIDSYLKLPPTVQSGVVWVYVPLIFEKLHRVWVRILNMDWPHETISLFVSFLVYISRTY